MSKTFFHTLPKEAELLGIPQQFTFPFYYQPHPLCQLAAEQVKAYLRTFEPWLKEKGGKMFGVLVARNDEGILGFLAAYSGNLDGRNDYSFFVPPVYDLLNPSGYFVQEEAAISAINHQIAALSEAESKRISKLKAERKSRSQALQEWLFEQYRLNNARGEYYNLMQIFRGKIPPGGTGECCAPKLMQAAYLAGWKPLCMAEFWMGPSPKDELRIEGNYYPSCRSKCKPILEFMMQGLDVEPNPLLEKNKAVIGQLKTVYEDEVLLVVNKPSGMLAVPGKDELPSVYSVIHERYPEATGPLIVHRLDMDTSGLMVLAKTEEAYHHLQQQFITHQIEKEYVALLDPQFCAHEPEGSGTIDLPLCVNPYDRPRQIVNAEYGKRAITHYIIEGRTPEGYIRVRFNPQTGRTHQLRVHAAHADGLGCPIVGDNLYGTAADRLYLHAEKISFFHPVTGERTTFIEKAF